MILILGSKGQLGIELERILPKEKALYLDRDYCDITKIEDIEKIFLNKRIDCIINCAAYTNVDLAEKEPETCNLINVLGLENIVKIANKYNSTVIHISTDYVFDGLKNTPYKETDLTNPINQYGRSKLLGENFLMKEIKTGIIIRTSWLYSFETTTNFVYKIKSLCETRKNLNIVYDQTGTPTNGRDLAFAIKKIIPEIKEGEKEIYHFSNEGIASWYDFAFEIVKKYKLNTKINPIRTEEFPTLAKRPHYSVLDKKKIKDRFNLEIKHWKESFYNN